MRYIVLGILPALLAAASPALAQQGYRLFGNAILVDRAALWRDWELQNDRVENLKVPITQTDMFTIGAQGIKPNFFRRTINVAPEAFNFSYPDKVRRGGKVISGGISTLSNDRLARRVVDDDLSTFWEPDTPPSYIDRLRDPRDFRLEGLRNWEMLLDLGRTVFADSIVVIFPNPDFEGEFLGDPIRSFALFASMGERFPFPLGTNLKFTLVGQAVVGDLLPLDPRQDPQGRYLRATFRLLPLDNADFNKDGRPDLSGSFIQYVKLTPTDSDFWRAGFIGQDEEGQALYEALPPERQGAVLYQRLTAGGFLVDLKDDEGADPRRPVPGKLTAEQKYQNLSPERQGPLLYFRKEVPRLAEIQVWAKGDNVILRPEARAGASFEEGGLGAPQLATDGVYDTEWAANAFSPILGRGTAWYDLGAVFWVDGMYAVMKRINQVILGAFFGHDFRVSDGTTLKPLFLDDKEDFPQLEDGLKWDQIISEGQVDNRQAPFVRMFSETFPLRKVRYLQVRNIDISGVRSGGYNEVGTLGEVALYGGGYPASVWAFSPQIRLTDRRGNFIRKTLPEISWEGEAIVRRLDPVSGRVEEVAEPLEDNPEVRILIQSRTSDQTDSVFTYFQEVKAGTQLIRDEITRDAFEDLQFKTRVWEAWLKLPVKHKSRRDDDGDGLVDEDPIDFKDNDGDGKVDEDGKKLRRPPPTPVKTGILSLVGWSPWSQSYTSTTNKGHALFRSPNPRKFLQIRVNIRSEDPNKTGRLKRVRLDLSPPLALDLAGELAVLNAPGQERPLRDLRVEPLDYRSPRNVDPLNPRMFSYFIRAAGPDPADRQVRGGFDEVLILTPQQAALRGVRLGEVMVETRPTLLDSEQTVTRALETRFTHFFQREADGAFRDATGDVMEVLPTGSDSLLLRLPFSINGGLDKSRHALVEVQFSTRTFLEGTEFVSFVRSSTGEEVFQSVDTNARDATELVDSGTARLSLMPVSGGLVKGVEMARVFTPNRDGINDELLVQFTLLQVLEERPVKVQFYDLQGRMVGEALNRSSGRGLDRAGVLEFAWDGRDFEGELVPPGIYLMRLRVEADKDNTEIVRSINVVY